MERGVYPNTEFRHADHLRLAWHYLRLLGEPAAVEQMRQTIRNFAVSLGHPEKYHDTVTIGWMRLVASALAGTPETPEFSDFLSGHRWLMNKDALLAFYTRARLESPQARSAWMEPDLHPLP